jgi:hypothetical protein
MKKFLPTVAALLLAPQLAFGEEAVASDVMSSMDDAVVMPFADGERLVYKVSLLGLTAGSAELRVEGGDDGEWRLHATGRTVGATDSIFGLRQSASCTVQGEALKPEVCLFTSRQRKGMKRREVRYDPATGDVRERVLEDGKRSDKTRNFGDEGVQEAVSGIYLLRKRFPAEGETMSFRAIRKGKAITIEAEALGTERVVTPAGSFEARVVDLRIITKVDKDAAQHAKVWFTDDARRIPIKVSVDAPVGTLQARLTAASKTQGHSVAGR